MNTRLSFISIVVGVFAAVFLAGYWFLLMPQFRALGTTLRQLDNTNLSLASSKNSAAAKQEREQQLASLQTQAEALLPTSDRQFELSVELEAAAKSSNVTITNLLLTPVDNSLPKTTSAAAEDNGTAKPAPASSLQKITLTMSVAGGYADIQQWVNKITSLDRFVQLDQLNISVNATNPSQLIAQATAFAYYLPAGK